MTWAYTTIEEEPPVYTTPSAPLSTQREEPNRTKERTPPALPAPKVQERLIYLDLENLPKKVYVGQLFTVTLKITALRRHVPCLIETMGGKNTTLVEGPTHLKPRAISHLIYRFKATGDPVVLPAFVVRYEDGDIRYKTRPVSLPTVVLNPPADFSHLLAEEVRLLNYQASAYDDHANILALRLHVVNGNVEDFRLPGALKQGTDEVTGTVGDREILYYGVFPLNQEEVAFSYFNLRTNRYETFRIPIIVKRSSVSTQTNLDPQASEFTQFKIAATTFFILVWLFLWYRRRRLIDLMLIAAAATYLLTYLIPLKSICLREGATLYLLPTPQSTPFMNLPFRTEAKEMDRKGTYIKVQLPNQRIGWVKNEDTCQP
jgi:hypothetical protein